MNLEHACEEVLANFLPDRIPYNIESEVFGFSH